MQIVLKSLHKLRRGTIAVTENTFETNIEGVFAGGEASTGPKDSY